MPSVCIIRVIPLNPFDAYAFEDWALLALLLNSYANIILMVFMTR